METDWTDLGPASDPPRRPTVFFEDLRVGVVGRWGPYVVSGEEIEGFARRFDPQRIHLAGFSAAGPFDRPIAAGWHVSSITMRLVVENWLVHVASIASPGVDNIAAHVPVHAGDALAAEAEVLDLRRSTSKPDRRIMRYRMSTFNQRDQLVATVETPLLVAARDRQG